MWVHSWVPAGSLCTWEILALVSPVCSLPAALNTAVFAVFPFSLPLAWLLSPSGWHLLTLSSQLIYLSTVCLQTFVFPPCTYSFDLIVPITSAALMQGVSPISVFSPDMSCMLQSPFPDQELGGPYLRAPPHILQIKYVQRGSFYVFSRTFTTSSSSIPFSVTVIFILPVA